MSLLAADYLVLLTTLDAEDYPAGRVIALPDDGRSHWRSNGQRA